MKVSLNQKGFGIVEGLLAVIAITLIVGVGFYVVSANKDKKTDTTAQTQNKTEKSTPAPKKDYLTVSELGLKLNKTDIPTAYYKLSQSEQQRAYPKVPELKMVLLYDKTFDNTKNSKGEACGSSQYGSEIVVFEAMSVADRDSKYAQYKNAELGPNDDVPTVVSDKYAKRVGDYLYDYYKAQGVQGLIGCIDSEDSQQDKQAETQYNSSYEKIKEMVTSVVKA